MEVFEDSEDFSGEYASDSSDYSGSPSDAASITTTSMGQAWSINRPSTNQLPPQDTSRRTPHLPRRQQLASRSESTLASHPNANHYHPSLTNQAHSTSNNPPPPREPAQFDLPNFPLPSANRDNRPSSFIEGRGPPPLALDPEGWGHWDSDLISPLTRPASRVSWGSIDSFDLPTNPTLSDFVDLTNANSPPNMASGTKRRPTASRSTTTSVAGGGPNKRRKVTAGVKKESARGVKNENLVIEEVDLRDVDDDDGLSKALQKQQESVIKAQRDEECGKPMRLSGLQCVVCLDNIKDMTATQCGAYP